MREKTKERIDKEFMHLQETINYIEEGLQDKNWNHFTTTAVGTYVANIYQGYESILRTILEDKNVYIKKGEDWHSNLLKTSKNEGLVPAEMSNVITGMLGFRHVQVHGYAYMLNKDELRVNSKDVVDSFPIFEKHIQEILEKEVLRETSKEQRDSRESDQEKAKLQLEAIKKRLQAQAAQEIVSQAKVIPRGMDSNLPNADLNGTQEAVLSSIDAGQTEVSNLLSDATNKDASAGRKNAISVAKEVMGKNTTATVATEGIPYEGKIVGKTDMYLIQRLTSNQAILHEIKNVSAEANIEVGAEIALLKHSDGRITERKTTENELDNDNEIERGGR